MEEPGRLQSMGSLRVRHDWALHFHFFTFMHCEKEMATHSSVLAWRIPGLGEPGGLTSMGSHRVRHDWSDLATVAARWPLELPPSPPYSSGQKGEGEEACTHFSSRTHSRTCFCLYPISQIWSHGHTWGWGMCGLYLGRGARVQLHTGDFMSKRE